MAGQRAGGTEAQEFAAAFRGFLDWFHLNAGSGAGNEAVELTRTFLGEVGAARSVVKREFAAFEHVNVQTALNSWLDQAGRVGEIHGVTLPPHYGSVSLSQLISGEGLPPLRIAAPELVDLPNGPGTTLACLTSALVMVEDGAGRFVLLVQGPSEHHQGVAVELAGLDVGAAQRVLSEVDELRAALNVYRGHVLDVAVTAMGSIMLTFAALDAPTRSHVVLPQAVLVRLERHALSLAEHRDALLAAGQHLKRGLLLYGPPGTGKRHSMRHLLGRMPGYTRLVLTGRSLHAVGAAAELARDLQPAVVVLEDVDLVAGDRSFGPGSSSVLFDLLDAMDGAAPDADLMFLLTTNRADLLEPALAARPGRVDIAIEIALPDADARGQLLQLYARSIPLAITDDERTESSSAPTASPPPSSRNSSAAPFWRRSTMTRHCPTSRPATSTKPSMTCSTAPKRSPGPCSASARSRSPTPAAAPPMPSRQGYFRGYGSSRYIGR